MVLNNIRYGQYYAAINELNQKGYSVSALCSVYGISRSAYYKWLNREKSPREAENEQIIHAIKLIYESVKGIYGYRRIADEYNALYGTNYNEKRFRRLTRLVGLRSTIRKKRYRYCRSTPEVTADNILNRDFNASALNTKWVTDITEMKCGNGQKLYLSAIMDLKTRDIVSFSMGRHNNNELVFKTFDLALQKYPNAHPLFHSDRGFQYTSKSFKRKIDAAKMIHSMSRVGRCIDNGPMEGFWGTLKSEMYYLERFDDYNSLASAIEEYIYFYNYIRRQRRLNCMAPMALRELLDRAS